MLDMSQMFHYICERTAHCKMNENKVQWQRHKVNEQAQRNSWCHFGAIREGAEVHSNWTLGEKWFQKLVITALITYSSSLLPLYLCLYLAAVYGQTFVTLPPCLRPLLSFTACEAMEIVLFFIQLGFSFHEFLHLSPKPLFHLCVSVGASTAVLEGVRVFSNGCLCCADSHNL